MLNIGSTLTISNEIESLQAKVTVHDGLILQIRSTDLIKYIQICEDFNKVHELFNKVTFIDRIYNIIIDESRCN